MLKSQCDVYKGKWRYLVSSPSGPCLFWYRHTAFRRAKELGGQLYEYVNGQWVFIKSYLN